MRTTELKKAIEEAQDFIEKAEKLLKMAKSAHLNIEAASYIGGYPKQQGFVRRSSLDLSRALADLRNPNVAN